MGYIRETKLKKGGSRFQAEVRLTGHPTLTAMFDRKTDAKAWIQKTEADIRCGRHHLYSEAKRHIFQEAVERYCKEQPISVAKYPRPRLLSQRMERALWVLGKQTPT